MKTVVQVQPLQPANHRVEIEAMGTVIAARRLELKPRVSGRVTRVAKTLIPGSLLAKDDLVIALDRQDYQLALERSQNNLRKAAMDLRLEQGNQAVAKKEFELIREYSDSGLNNAPLDPALRKPQLALDIKNEVDRITTFPVDAEEPSVTVPIRRRSVITLILYGELSRPVLRETAEMVRDQLLQDPAIAQVELLGARPLEISIDETSRGRAAMPQWSMPQFPASAPFCSPP